MIRAQRSPGDRPVDFGTAIAEEGCSSEEIEAGAKQTRTALHTYVRFRGNAPRDHMYARAATRSLQRIFRFGLCRRG